MGVKTGNTKGRESKEEKVEITYVIEQKMTSFYLKDTKETRIKYKIKKKKRQKLLDK